MRRQLGIAFFALMVVAVVLISVSCPMSTATEENARPLLETRKGKLFWALVDCYDLPQVRKLKSVTEPSDGYFGGPQAMPPQEKLLRLQHSFGNMPEYWQAMYLLTEDDDEAKNEYLREALQVAPESTDNMYFAEVYPRPVKREKWLTREEDNIRSLKEIVALVPGEAFFHYELAYNYEKLGEMDAALEQLRLGNQAPVDRKPRLFPMSFVIEHVDTFLDADLSEDDRACVGAMLSAHEWLNFITRKDMIKEMIVALNLSADTDMLNAVHRYAVRMGLVENATALEAWVAVAFVMLLAEGYVDLSGDSPERDAVQGLLDLSKQTMDEISGGDYLGNERPLLETLSMPFAPDEETGTYRVSERYGNVYAVYASFQDILREDIALRNRIQREFLSIASSFDYTNPAAFAEGMQNEGGEK